MEYTVPQYLMIIPAILLIGFIVYISFIRKLKYSDSTLYILEILNTLNGFSLSLNHNGHMRNLGIVEVLIGIVVMWSTWNNRKRLVRYFFVNKKQRNYTDVEMGKGYPFNYIWSANVQQVRNPLLKLIYKRYYQQVTLYKLGLREKDSLNVPGG